MTRRFATGEGQVPHPLLKDVFMRECDPDFIIDWHCNVYGVSKPLLKKTIGKRLFHGSYYQDTKTITYTKAVAGVILHELAHHICHEQKLNGHKDAHNLNFGIILQELIDSEVY